MGKKEPTNEAQSERDGNGTEMFSNKTVYLIYITIVYVCVCAVIERLSFMCSCVCVLYSYLSRLHTSVTKQMFFLQQSVHRSFTKSKHEKQKKVAITKTTIIVIHREKERHSND